MTSNQRYGNVVDILQRNHYTQSNRYRIPTPPNNQRSNVDSSTLDEIRRRAREVWLRPQTSQTTYSDHYNEKISEMDSPTKSRPTSSHRHNRPHPPMIFLSNHLHSVPGYHNADATLGKEVYQVDRSLAHCDQMARNSIKAKFSNRPNTAAVMQYKRDDDIECIGDARRRAAAEASRKLTKTEGLMLCEHRDEDYIEDEIKIQEDFTRAMQPRVTIPSVHRYLKGAGVQELDNIMSVGRRAASAHPTIGRRTDIHTMQQQDWQQMRKIRYQHQSKRGDFLIHPEWRPHIYHHRLNGLSSVEIPYSIGRR